MSRPNDLTLNWRDLGHQLRQSALDAHNGTLPPVTVAYFFLLDNPECFGVEEWPDTMPRDPNIELIAAYYNAFDDLTLPAVSPSSGLAAACAPVAPDGGGAQSPLDDQGDPLPEPCPNCEETEGQLIEREYTSYQDGGILTDVVITCTLCDRSNAAYRAADDELALRKEQS